MEKTILQQNELDKIEKLVLITLFGKESIPESTSVIFRLMKINPNNYIEKFENMMIPIMNDDGLIDGKMLKKLLYLSKYNEFINLFSIPDKDFYLSDIAVSIVQNFLPGVIA